MRGTVINEVYKLSVVIVEQIEIDSIRQLNLLIRQTQQLALRQINFLQYCRFCSYQNKLTTKTYKFNHITVGLKHAWRLNSSLIVICHVSAKG